MLTFQNYLHYERQQEKGRNNELPNFRFKFSAGQNSTYQPYPQSLVGDGNRTHSEYFISWLRND